MPDYNGGTASIQIKPSFRNFVRDARAQLERINLHLDVQVGADTRRAAEEMETFRRAVGGPLDIRASMDTRIAAAEMEAFRRAVSYAIRVRVDVDTGQAQARVAALRASARNSFSGAGLL